MAVSLIPFGGLRGPNVCIVSFEYKSMPFFLRWVALDE